MKHFNHTKVITAIVVLAALVSSCGGGAKRHPNSAYMPDMVYSRAYETYALRDSMIFTTDRNEAGHKIYYNNKPVSGTMSKDELLPYTLPNDSNGYKMSAAVQNPVASLPTADSLETARLFNINCGICHGAKGTADGPLATSGKVGGVANLTADAYIKMADGTMYHSITYGKGNMGSYASQLDRKQRWQLVQYIRTLQPKPKPATGTEPAKADTVKGKL